MMKKTINITNGPSREDLFDGLRLFAEKRFLKFMIKGKEKQEEAPVLMCSIEAEDGSGESWNLSFFIDEHLVKKPESLTVVKKVPETASLSIIKKFSAGRPIDFITDQQIIVKAYYSSKNRKGVIVIE